MPERSTTPAIRTSPATLSEPGATLPEWRRRWFWRWQAWRLRKRQHHETGHGVGVYDCLDALEKFGYADAFPALQQGLAVSTPGMLADGAQAFRRRLSRELGTPAVAVMIGAPDGSLGGYAWGRAGRLIEAMRHYQQVQSLGHLRAEDWQAIEARAAAACGNTRVLTIHGIGLAPRWRKGFGPLKQLLKPLLDLGLRNNATRALWWTPRGSSLHAISLGFGARLLHESSACSLFLLADLRPLARVFAALPASGIADLLARIAPLRRPQQAVSTRSAAFERARGKRVRGVAA